MSDSFLNQYEPYLIFPTIIKKYSFAKSDELKDCLFEIINKKYNEDEYNSHHSETISFFNNVTGSSLFKYFSEVYPVIKEFHDFCTLCAKDYTANVLSYNVQSEMVCTNSWVNYYSTLESHQEPHVHVNSFVSSNYFANYNPSEHAPLMFKKQEDLASMPFVSQTKSTDRAQPIVWDVAHFDYSEGDILFWQSHLFHFVPKSKVPGRLTVACNYMPHVVDLGGYGFKVTTT